MPASEQIFSDRVAHRAWLASQAALPRGFRTGATRFAFTPVEVGKPAHMTATVIVLDAPTPVFAGMFTRNAFPGAPILVGRRRLAEATLGAVVVNNKVSNVCAPDGEAAAEQVCVAAARLLDLRPEQVLPSSTGVIGWRLPAAELCAALPAAVAALQGDSVLPAAEGIVTTDLFPKVRRATVGGGSIVGIAKGAGMIEPNLATMLVYLLTDCDVPRDHLRRTLAAAVDISFNSMSIDSDTSTSDTVVALSSQRALCPDLGLFDSALATLCQDLCGDVVRNGEGVHHVIAVTVEGAPDRVSARALGKAVVNSPLFQCAVCGNDANVGRLLAAIGKHVGALPTPYDVSRCQVTLGGEVIFQGGVFRLDPAKEQRLVAHLRHAELYASTPPADGLTFSPPIDFPPHQRVVDIVISLGLGSGACRVLGADRSHEYISENADYRS